MLSYCSEWLLRKLGEQRLPLTYPSVSSPHVVCIETEHLRVTIILTPSNTKMTKLFTKTWLYERAILYVMHVDGIVIIDYWLALNVKL